MSERLAKHAPSRVRPGIYLGSIEALTHIPALNITHVLSLGPVPATTPVELKGVERLHINVLDTDNADLLQFLDPCCSFVATALASESGAVLVHCLAGVSRSAAVVVAYLARSEGLTIGEALESVRAEHPAANPNDGFMQQLELYHDMGFTLVPNNAAYKRFTLQQLGQRWEMNGYVESAELGEVEDGGAESEAVTYRCRKCRRLLATSLHAVPVEPGPGAGGFSFSKRSKPQGPQTAKETSLFVQPLRWMEGAIGEVNGKLYCPKCNERLGSFNWAGIQSNSGSWVVPAFQLHLSKLDTVSPKLDTELAARVRQPRLLPPPMSAGSGDSDVCHRIRDCGYLIFDCDGVLVDSESMSCEALRQAVLEVTRLDIPHVFPQDFYPLFGMDVRSSCRYYAETFGTGWDIDEVAEKVSAAKERHYKELTAAGVSAFGFIGELVGKAMERGMAVGVGSSGSPEKIEHSLSSAGLIELFPKHLIVSAKMVTNGKPAPDIYLEVMRRMGCSQPYRAIIIEDAVTGLKAARAAGGIAVAITNTLPRDVLAPHADLVVDSLDELVAVLA